MQNLDALTYITTFSYLCSCTSIDAFKSEKLFSKNIQSSFSLDFIINCANVKLGSYSRYPKQ